MEPNGIYVILSVNATEYHWGSMSPATTCARAALFTTPTTRQAVGLTSANIPTILFVRKC
ncbi:hypothetical protein CISG_03191 [Coccidioides immitis RMSCC 3703]|uniref:Uncharacterized protein n=2 Tax=Coccidioides immitis TaxID=5501 RepID=A0A0J8TGJ4_COCIT|nr:hypothetical protein CIRG_01136 [Coccidioides immitis RMSCC 2394]KMU72757.1 hypothetical protein CISG_03191 [Coccidioides immitis RMSCC 3703]